MAEAEYQGYCDICRSDVSYEPGQPKGDGRWEFDHEANEDRVYHARCIDGPDPPPRPGDD